MDVVSTCPLRVASMVWPPAPGFSALTVVCKATFQLQPGEAELLEEQEAPVEDDAYWEGNPAGSLCAPSEIVPYKTRADVLLVGRAFAPEGKPVRSLLARVVVGKVDKSIEVWCDRIFWQDGQVLEGQPFATMALRYERAAGGPGTSNPVGMQFDAPPDEHGAVRIPNLQPPGAVIGRRGDTFAPIGFGPIAPGWPERAEKLPGQAEGWSYRRWRGRALPERLDPAYFNAAPRDQQVKAIRPDESIVLENLHPEHPRLVTRLPGIQPRARVVRGGQVGEEVKLIGDTLWINTVRAVATVVWRGSVALRHPDEEGVVMVTMEGAGSTVEVPAWARGGAGASVDVLATLVLPGTGGDEQKTTMPLIAGSEDWARGVPLVNSSNVRETLDGALVRGPALPFAPAAQSPWAHFRLSPPPERTKGSSSDGTETLPAPLAPARKVLPFVPEAPRAEDPSAVLPGDSSGSGPGADPAAAWASVRGMEGGFHPLILDMEARPAEVVPPSNAEPPAPPLMIGPLATSEMVERERAKGAAEATEATGEVQAPAAVEVVEAKTAQEEPKKELSVERCAAITASIGRRREEMGRILEENGLTKEEWAEIEKRWAEEITKEVSRGRVELLRRFDAAYVEQLEKERGVIHVEEYARLTVAAERGTIGEVLGELSLPRGAAMPIERIWVGRMVEDTRLAVRIRERVDEARRA